MATDFNTLLEDTDQLCIGFAAIEASLTPKHREALCSLFLSPSGELAHRDSRNRVISPARSTCSHLGNLLTKHFGGVGPEYSMSWIGFIEPKDDGNEYWVMREKVRGVLRSLGWFDERLTPKHPENTDTSEYQEPNFAERAARFALVKVRTEQAAFRSAVFAACGGRCVISGNAVPQALEAAHRRGRNWHEGHNAAADGFLLRRDLHALYDSSLLSIKEDGCVVFHPDIAPDYLEFAGRVVPAAVFNIQKRQPET